MRELGKISKTILERINSELRKKLGVNQWKNTKATIDWFHSINNKQNCLFLQLDIKEFYPSITERMLAQEQIIIKPNEILKHFGKSLLFHNEEAWIKKDEIFDSTMGSFDGAETYEIIGIYFLHELSKIIDRNDIVVYRDDGLIILRNCNKQNPDKTRKSIIKIF